MSTRILIVSASVTTSGELLSLFEASCSVSVVELGSRISRRIIIENDIVILVGSVEHNCEKFLELVPFLRKTYPQAFVVALFDDNITARARQLLFNTDINMVTNDTISLNVAVDKVKSLVTQSGFLTCPYCGFCGLSEDGLWEHVPLYHANAPNIAADCTICGKSFEELGGRPNYPVHLHNAHGPAGRGEVHSEYLNKTDKLYAFALVVVRHPATGRYLLVQEFTNSGFWLPGGRVDSGETLAQAAVRETREEAGVDVTLTGILGMEYHPQNGYVRQRVIFMAEPRDLEQKPKTLPDYESVGAVWASAQEVEEGRGLRLRGWEPRKWFGYVEDGGAVVPMSFLR